MSDIFRYPVVPHSGVGPVRFGMHRDEVRQIMPGPCEPFRKTPECMHQTDAFHHAAFQVFYCGKSPTVEYVELSRGSVVIAEYRGVDIFSTPADRVVDLIAGETPYDAGDPELGFSYVFPELDLSLWRPVCPNSTNFSQGIEFSTIGIGTRGYYSRRG